jgi:dUTP pyrophosphatase
MQFISTSTASIYVLNSFRNILTHQTFNDKFMHLKIFVDSEDLELRDIYMNAAATHNQKIIQDPHFFDAGFDLFLPQNMHFYMPGRTETHVNKVDFKIKCSAKVCMLDRYDTTNKEYSTGFYTHPRSSLSKTPLRLANSTGIIDAGYRGNLIGMFDCVWSTEAAGMINSDYSSARFSRLLQICAPNLMPIFVEIVDSIEALGPNTSRGEGGIGSTGI